jgi:uncharacterized radical SAM protein YgiQ
MERLGWDALDVLIVTGDAHVDHPAFGAALLGRWLVAHGYRVGIVAQPRWDTPADIAVMGRPRLFAGVTAGALDSMLAHYTAFRKKRHDDAYTPGNRAGARPNRATIVYTGLIRAAFPGLPVVIGGIEASLRRAAHYDFWSDRLRRSILLDSKADLLVYGMGERAVIETADRMHTAVAAGAPFDPQPLYGIPGAAFAPRKDPFAFPHGASVIRLPSLEEIEADPTRLMTATLALERQVHDGSSWAVQSAGGRDVVFAPPAAPLATEELDALYALPFTRRPHPHYQEPIPAVEMIRFSVTAHRGCGGGCSFCSVALHQGRRIQSRSKKSILREVERLTAHPDWKGSVSDVGGPSANMWRATCAADPAPCRRSSCLYPEICANFKGNQRAIIDLLDAIARLPKVRHVRVASGVRHDLALTEPDYIRALIGRFTGGQLKIAPEHVCDRVLRLMRKPGFESFARFLTFFERESRGAGKEQYIVPYLMSAFPGCADRDMQELADRLRSTGWKPQQVQCFIPTPGTAATAMYYAGIDPQGHPIPVPRTDAERMRQHYLLAPPKEHAPGSRRKVQTTQHRKKP